MMGGSKHSSKKGKKSTPPPPQPPPPVASKACKLCDFTCDSLAILNNHMESSHLNQSLFQCRLCSGLHKTKDDLLVHYGVLHQNDPLQYKVVPLGAEEEEDENDSQSDSGDGTNVMRESSKEDLKCEYCLFEGASASDLKQHMDDNHGNEQVIMEGIENQSESILKQVLAGKSSPGSKLIVLRYECKHCNYQTRECVTIRRHVMTHINYKPYSCPLCNTSSIRSNTVKSHLRLYHKNNTLKPKYMKNDKMEGMIHQSIEKVYATPAERNRIYSKENLKNQSTESFKSPSDIAKRSSSRPSNGEQSCRGNGVSGVTGNMEEAEESGSEGGGQVKYSCKLCGYSYHGTSQNIRRHVMVHFNYRKFRCPYCEFTAVQSNNVTQHIQGIHENKPIKYLTVRDEDMERRLDDAIVKFGSDSTPQSIQHRKKIERVSYNQGKGLSFKGDEYHPNGRKSQLGVNKPRKLSQEQIIPPRPGEFLYYKCKICNFTENSSSRKCTNMRRHVMSHLNYKRYACPYCPFGATTTCMAKAHTSRKHVGKRVYCLDKKDPVMEKLMRANIIKVGGKPWTTYSYEDGGTPFKQKSRESGGPIPSSTSPTPPRPANMKSPMTPIEKVPISASDRLKVTAELAEEDRGFGNYQCKFCMKRLANSSAIKRHVAAHFYYRRYGCPYCELLFTQSTFAVNHVRSKHKGMAVYYMDNKDPKMEAKIRRSWVNISADEESEEFNAACIVRGAGKRKIKKPQKALQVEQDVLKSIKCEEESSLLLRHLTETGQESMDAGLYNEDNDISHDEPENPFEMNDLGTVSMAIEENGEATANGISESDSPTPVKQKAFKCCQCDYETEHKTSMIRHVMWKIGYKPYHCGLCSFTDVLYIGLKKHAVRKHKHEPFNPIISKDPEKEAEVEDIMTRSTVYLPKGEKVGSSMLDELDSDVQSWWKSEVLSPLPCVLDNATVSMETVLAGTGLEQLGIDQILLEEARIPKPKAETSKGHKTSDEPIPEDVVRRSVNKSKCEICGKISSSKGYIYNHVIRHGPPKLRCEHCTVCFYFPKEAKTHNEKKHPELPLKVKRLWGVSKWDKKTQGIEPADPVDKESDSGDKLSTMDFEETGSLEDEEGNSLLMEEDGEFDDSNHDNNSVARETTATTQSINMPIFPQPELTTVAIDGQSENLGQIEPRNTEMPNIDGVVFEDGILERTPVRIPMKDPVTGIYQCVYCSYSTKNPTHIKCHALVHQPPHWRCDHCTKTFLMLYKLRKHSSTVHKFQPLMYTNLITGENCIGNKINYENAVFPNREGGKSDKASVAPPVDNNSQLNEAISGDNNDFNNGDNNDDNMDTDSETSGSEWDVDDYEMVSVSGEAEDYSELSLKCPECDFSSHSEQELLMHLYLHRTNPNLNKPKMPQCKTLEDEHEMAEDKITENKPTDLISHGEMTEDKPTDLISHGERNEDNPTDIINPGEMAEDKIIENNATDLISIDNSNSSPNGDNVYRCALCDFTAKSCEDLTTHRSSSHTLEKPYKCSHCDYSAYLQIPVMLHCFKAHPEESVSLETKDIDVHLDIKTDEGNEERVDFNPNSSLFHLHPSIELRNFLDLPIELLHAFMVQHGLTEIHQ